MSEEAAMKYFTLEHVAGDDEGAWDRALADYETHLASIRPRFTAAMAHFLDDYCLHDARVLAFGTRESSRVFFIALLLENSEEDGVELQFQLAGPAKLTPAGSRPQQLYWAYEELDAITAGDIEVFRMSILFANGAELHLPFSELRVAKLRLWQGSPNGTFGQSVGAGS